MAWIAIADHDGQRFWPQGFGQPVRAPDMPDDALLTCGSLVIETRVPTSRRPEPLVSLTRGGDWPFHFSLQSLPGGGLTLILDQGGEILHRTVGHSEAGRTDVLRVTYSWDAPGRWGRLALEWTDQEKAALVVVADPNPLRLCDAAELFRRAPERYLAPEVQYMALFDGIEPVGPMPSFLPDVPIATPQGYRPISKLRRGDTVLSGAGEIVPVLHNVTRCVPAFGSFRPVRLRAPYFGLLQDICVAPSQRLVLSGSEVEYNFGQESVLVPVRHLLGGSAVVPASCGPTVTYMQLLLPGHETLVAAGTETESLFIGRLRRNRAHLEASLLAGYDRATLPDHGRSVFPGLKAFDAIVLAEYRAA